jgi:hypothetical protein
MRLLSTLNYWDTRNPLFILQFTGLRRIKMGREKLVPPENVPFHRPKLHWKKIAVCNATSYRELGRKIHVHQNVFEKKWKSNPKPNLQPQHLQPQNVNNPSSNLSSHS